MSGWSYSGADAGIQLFDACLKAGAMAFTPGMRVLELGCCESDWLERASKAWPEVEFIGMDCRTDPKKSRGRYSLVKHDARLPRPEWDGQFDAIVSLSAIEHVGLGHYGDPKDDYGDTLAVSRVHEWLKPGGWFYFDVPYDPTRYWLQGTKCRVYDDRAIWERLWSRFAFSCDRRGVLYVGADAPDLLVPKPSEPHSRYWYAAHVWRKGHTDAS
jgi:SAM-dependent methyltransferase